MFGMKLHKGDDSALNDLNRFMAQLNTEDDRALVLSLAAFIEETLGRLLLAYFRDCKATKELVEGFNAPLGTLSARVKAAYSFGLASEEQFRDMEILRKVRNLFAHDWEGVTLERNDVAAMLGQLSGYTVQGHQIEATGRQKLVGSLCTLCMELQIFVCKLKDGTYKKAPDVCFRLTTTPYTGSNPARTV